MPDVQFEENNFPQGRFTPGASQSPGLVKVIMKLGIVKDEKSANYILIGIAVCAVLLTIFVLKKSFGGSGAKSNRNIIPAMALPERRP